MLSLCLVHTYWNVTLCSIIKINKFNKNAGRHLSQCLGCRLGCVHPTSQLLGLAQLHFQSQPPSNAHMSRHRVIAQVVKSVPPMWKTQVTFLAFGLAQPGLLRASGQGNSGWELSSVSCTVSLGSKMNKQNKKQKAHLIHVRMASKNNNENKQKRIGVKWCEWIGTLWHCWCKYNVKWCSH